MKLLIVILLFISTLISLSNCGSVTNVVHSVTGVEGEWKKRWAWNSKWVKSWTPKTIYISKWTRVWTPAEIKEYVPYSPLPTATSGNHHQHIHIKSSSVHY